MAKEDKNQKLLTDAAAKIIKKAGKLYDQGSGYGVYKGDRVADFSQPTLEAFRGIKSTARDQASGGLGDQSVDVVSQLLSGNMGIGTESDLRDLLARSGNDAFMQDVIDKQAGKLTDDINRAVGMNEGAIGGAYHTGTIADQVGDFRQRAAADNWYQNLANERGIIGDISNVRAGDIANRVSGIGLAPTATESLYDPYGRLGEVGAAKESMNAAEIQAAMDKFSERDMADWNRLGAFSGALGGASSFMPQPQAQQASNPFGAALGGGILGNQLSGGSTLGTLLGAGGGLLSGILSDDRMKTDKKRVGRTDDGLPIFTYRYRSGGPTQMGMMASDVEEKRPEAVYRDNRGVRYVNYAMAA